MIDPHVHLRDWNQRSKETVAHGISIALRLGFDGLFDQSNTDPPLTSPAMVRKRFELADKVSDPETFFYGVYGGITGESGQMEEMLRCVKENTRVVATKLFAGSSTAAFGLSEEEQLLYYRIAASLHYDGVTAVHCEKPEFFTDCFDPVDPISHTKARPPEAEVESVKDQIRFSEEAGYRGTLHICHVSVPQTIVEIESARPRVRFRLTCEAAPHHVLLWDEWMRKANGIYFKMNPPLRPRKMQKELFRAVCEGRVDCLATDHAPHTFTDKSEQYASGVPSWVFYRKAVAELREAGASDRLLDGLTHENAVAIFSVRDSINKKTSYAAMIETPGITDEEIAEEYGFPSELLNLFENYNEE